MANAIDKNVAESAREYRLMAGWRDKAVEAGEGIWIILLAAWVLIQPLLVTAGHAIAAASKALWQRWSSLDARTQRRYFLGLGAILALMYVWSWREVPAHWMAYLSGERPLYAAKNWHYQLDKVVVDDLVKVNTDILVTDYGTMGGKVPLPASEVTRLKTRADGRKRIVLAYMSVGEAERFRFYFKDEWKTDPPEWLGAENCAWPDAFKVQFWHDGWKDIVWRGRKAYLKQIIDAGFDGVYLDRVDIYDQYPDNPDARDQMIKFVSDLSALAKKLKPGFLIVPQNADDLLSEPEYRAVIDGLGREDLLYGTKGTGTRNPGHEIYQAQERLDLLRWEWKPILAVEYLQTAEAIVAAAKELKARGLVGTVQPRALDGADPTAPVDLTKNIGTTEYTKANCEKGKSW